MEDGLDILQIAQVSQLKEHGAIFEISAKGVSITKDNIAFGNIPLIIDKLATKPSKKGAEAHI